jgi:hypothetical protein
MRLPLDTCKFTPSAALMRCVSPVGFLLDPTGRAVKVSTHTTSMRLCPKVVARFGHIVNALTAFVLLLTACKPVQIQAVAVFNFQVSVTP